VPIVQEREAAAAPNGIRGDHKALLVLLDLETAVAFFAAAAGEVRTREPVPAVPPADDVPVHQAPRHRAPIFQVPTPAGNRALKPRGGFCFSGLSTTRRSATRQSVAKCGQGRKYPPMTDTTMQHDIDAQAARITRAFAAAALVAFLLAAAIIARGAIRPQDENQGGEVATEGVASQPDPATPAEDPGKRSGEGSSFGLNAIAAWETPQDPTIGWIPAAAVAREVSAYNSVPEQTDDTPCIAADGSDICARHAAGETICAANFVPLGTWLRIQSRPKYQREIRCIVADRMNRRYHYAVDVFMGSDIERARTFGRQTLFVTVLE
jgi:3D (Asp-Asp-Asp) domain-containing protein